MKIALDTNVFVSGIFFFGPPYFDAPNRLKGHPLFPKCTVFAFL